MPDITIILARGTGLPPVTYGPEPESRAWARVYGLIDLHGLQMWHVEEEGATIVIDAASYYTRAAALARKS